MLRRHGTRPKGGAGRRGTVLVLVLLVLALFSVVAAVWTLQASLQRASAEEYAQSLAVRAAGDAAVEHARAALSAARLFPAEAIGPWVVLSSTRTDVTEYRVTLRDTSQMPMRALPWPASIARRASAVVPTHVGWRWVIDPLVSSYEELRQACAEALRQSGGNVQHASALALALADAYDDNTALSVAEDGTVGCEGLTLVGVLRGDDRIFPAASIVRQSAFYDVEYERDNFAIFGAFAIEDVEPVLEEAGHTNTRIRLSNRLSNPVRQQEWEAFQRLWRRVYSTRFIPHAWRGQKALIVTECGGASTTMTILDNDGEWLYFTGYPHRACVRGRYVSIKLCSQRARPGCLVAEAQGAVDVWFVTGLNEHAAYRLTWYGEGTRVVPEAKLVWGKGQYRGGLALTHALEAAVGFEVTLTPNLPVSALRLTQPDVVAWGYRGVQPLQVGGWSWQRVMPEGLTDWLLAWSNAPTTALLMPGGLWYWSSDSSYVADRERVTSFVRGEECGSPYVVEAVQLEPSPIGGWAWRIRAQVQRLHPWVPGEWRGAVCVRAQDSNDPARVAFVVLDNDANTLLVHVGTRAMAASLAPAIGSWIRLGGLAESARRANHAIISILGQLCAQEPRVNTRPVLNTWMTRMHGQWQPRAPESLATGSTADTSTARISHSPVWNEIRASTHDAERLQEILDTWIRPLGIELPVNAITAPANWRATYVTLRRLSGTHWQLPRLYARWPRDFWRGAEVVFHDPPARARVVHSRDATLVLDHEASAPTRTRATLAPVAGVVFHVAADERAEGTWEWRLPSDICLPGALYVLGFCPPASNTAARFQVAVWNARRNDFDVFDEDAKFNQHDVMFAGIVTDDHVVSGQWLRLRLRANGGPAWVRGAYLVPCAWAGRSACELKGLVSDNACVEIAARIRRATNTIAACWGTALLVRRWENADGELVPIVECARCQWRQTLWSGTRRGPSQ